MFYYLTELDRGAEVFFIKYIYMSYSRVWHLNISWSGMWEQYLPASLISPWMLHGSTQWLSQSFPNHLSLVSFFSCLSVLLIPVLPQQTDFYLVSQFPCMPPSFKSPSLFLSCPGFLLFFSSSFSSFFYINYLVPFSPKNQPTKTKMATTKPQLLLVFPFSHHSKVIAFCVAWLCYPTIPAAVLPETQFVRG